MGRHIRSIVPLLLVVALGISGCSLFGKQEVPENPFKGWDFVDHANKLGDYWSPGGNPSEVLYIADSTTNSSVPPGQYRLYGEAGDDFAMANAFFPVSPGDWELQFRAKMASLGTFREDVDIDTGSRTADRGFTIGVRFDGTQTFVFGFNKGILGALNSDEIYVTLDESILGGNETEFHVWRIVYRHDAKTATVYKDDVQVAHFTNVRGRSSTAQGGLRIFSAPIDVTGTIDVYVDYIAFRRLD